MTEVVIAGIGQIPVGEHFNLGLREMGVRALRQALRDSGELKPQALYIGNMLAATISHQSNLGALFSDYTRLDGIESYTTEAAGASGAAALRLGYLAILSGYVDTVAVLGVEKVTDLKTEDFEAALSQGLDFDYEAIPGSTSSAQAGMLMRRYLHEYSLPEGALGGFPVQAHANGLHNRNAHFHRNLDLKTYAAAEKLNDPLNIYDSSPHLDGAAALILTRRDLLPDGFDRPLVRLAGSSAATDRLALHDRENMLSFRAAHDAVEDAALQAGIMPIYSDLFELDDSFSIYAALTLEACGFAEVGTAWQMARDGLLAPKAKLPTMTMGGCKARGNPLGAMGVYQAVEVVQQLRGEAGENQVPDARVGLTLALGGPASTAIAHVFERTENR